MKTLLILRHAKAVPKDPSISDHDRPLDKVGEDDALHLGKLIKEKDIIPSSIISSTALRAKTTAEFVAKGCNYKGDIAVDQSLYEAKPKDYLAILEKLSDRYSNVLIVGQSSSGRYDTNAHRHIPRIVHTPVYISSSNSTNRKVV